MTNSVRVQTHEPAIEVAGLRKTYPGDIVALDGLDLTVGPATVFGLLGPNGAGKSTTVKILTTLSRPDEGAALVAGVDVVGEPERVRRNVGYVAQKSGADLQATGMENLLLQARVHGLDRPEARRAAARLSDRFGLAEASGRRVKTWSGGMRRRLDIALALIHAPKVLFLDEPTTGLDPEVRADLWDEVRRLRNDDGITVLLTTHYLEEADALADRLAIMDRGRVVAEGTPSAMKDDMEGDGLHVVLASAEHTGEAAAVLTGAGLGGVVVDGQAVHARADRGAEAVPRILLALDRSGIEVHEVTVSRPSLDDVFLRHTGRRYSPDDPEVSS